MATEPKTLPTHVTRLPGALGRVAQLAESPALMEAERWFTRERPWINEQHLQLCRIAAPTFFETDRAEWFRVRLNELGWSAKLDRAGNVLATFGSSPRRPAMVVSAHLDTVFAPRRPEDVYFSPDGRLIGPGVSDNGAGLSAILALARFLAGTVELHRLASSLLIVANVGEEGEGNLSGMRYLCRAGSELQQIAAFLVLDGPSTEHITTQALASRRYEVTFYGPGGHSWNDYGTPNPVHAMGDLVSYFVQTAEAKVAAVRNSRCSYNFGVLEGGTSINSIPVSSRAKLDLRSEDGSLLDDLAKVLNASVERSLERINRVSQSARLTAKIKELGSRPSGRLSEKSPLVQGIQSVDAYLGIRSRMHCASTDANVPLSMGLPAVSIGVGGQGGGAHTAGEWYQPDGRELGLRRILLLLSLISEDLTSC